jgi:hypothetical protein
VSVCGKSGGGEEREGERERERERERTFLEEVRKEKSERGIPSFSVC